MNFKRRVSRLRELMDEKHLPSVLVSHPDDVFYYSGYQAGVDDHPVLLVKKGGEPLLFLSPLTGAVKAYADVINFSKKKVCGDSYHG